MMQDHSIKDPKHEKVDAFVGSMIEAFFINISYQLCIYCKLVFNMAPCKTDA